MSTLYMFKGLTESLVEELCGTIPVISNGEVTVVFIDDFVTLDEDFQETLLEYEVEEK